MWGLYMRWTDSFVLMEKGTESYIRRLAEIMEDDGMDMEDIKIAPIQ